MTTKTTVVPDITLNDGNRMPQLGFGVFLVPEDETAQAVGSGARDRLPVDRHRRRVRQRGRRTQRRAHERAQPRRPVHHDQAPEQRSRAPQRATRVRGEPRQARWRLHRPLPDPLASSAQRSDRRDLGGIGRAPKARSASGRSASPTSGSRTSSGSSTPPASYPRSTRSSSTPASSSSSCAGFTRSTGSPPRRGARWGRPSSWTSRRSSGSRPPTAALPRRSCSAGTSSSGTS